MPTVKRYMIHQIFTELVVRAGNENLYFDYEKSSIVHVITHDNNVTILEVYKYWFGGTVLSIDSLGGNRHSIINTMKGCYKWMILGREAYLLCRDLLPHLAPTIKFEYCQKLMMKYMSNENREHR